MVTRTVALILAGALLAGCSGANRLLPAFPLANARVTPDRGDVRALLRVRIPRGSERRVLHPSTISPLTRSVSIAVNSAKAQVFDAPPATRGCTAGTNGTTCTFAVRARAGTDTFTVTTYGGLNGKGTALDRGVVTGVKIAKGKANRVAVTLGPVVTTTADGGPGSLRYAVAAANRGDTVMFLLPKGSTVTLASTISIFTAVTIAGPGAANLAISGGNAHQLFFNTGDATISGLTLTHGKAASLGQPGGAISNVGAMTLIDDVIGQNTSIVGALRRAHGRAPNARHLRPRCAITYNQGGALYNDGTLTISDTVFSKNVIQNNIPSCIESEGGAIYNATFATLNSTHDTYKGNSAWAGGAVYSAATGAATFTDDTFSGNYNCAAASGCPTTGCGATGCTSFAQGEGAAILDDGSTGMTVTHGTFTGNVSGGKTAGSSGAGGAVVLESQQPAITNSTFTGNLAGGGSASCSTGEGGAILSQNPIELDGDTFKNNFAGGDKTGEGGAVLVEASVSGTGDTFTGNSVVGSGGSCTATGEAIGGAVASIGTATFTNSAFTNNTATANNTTAGGALFAAAGTIASSTFASNAALSTGTGGAASVEAIGGAVFVSGTGKVGGSTFKANAATIEGTGALEALGGAVTFEGTSATSSGNTFLSNAAVEKTGTKTAGGGALAALSAKLVSSGDTFTSNSVRSTGAADGGAVFAVAGAQISNAAVTKNSATGAVETDGGGLWLGSGGATLTNVTVTGNSSNASAGTATAYGGGVFDIGGGSITAGVIDQNKASTAGGGVFAEASETYVSTSVVGNAVPKASMAASGGAGIFEANGVILAYSTVANNRLTVSGPGPASGGGIDALGGVDLIQSTVSGNKLLGSAPNSGGGGIFAAATFDALNSTISNNASSIDGGGIMNVGSPATFNNATLYANAAAGKGGNIDNLATMTLTNSIAAGGHAASGADVYNAPAATITSNGYDIFGSTFVGGGTYNMALGDKLNTDPKLLPLANNGGPTFTNADQSKSPGRAYIPYSGGLCGNYPNTEDQRFFARGAGGRCDAGAYEYAGVATMSRHRPALPKPQFGSNARAPHVRVPHLRPIQFRLLKVN